MYHDTCTNPFDDCFHCKLDIAYMKALAIELGKPLPSDYLDWPE